MTRNLTIAIGTNMPDPLEGKKLSHEFARIISGALRNAATQQGDEPDANKRASHR